MKNKKTVKKKIRYEIRITDIPKDFFFKVKDTAKENDRSIGKEIWNAIKNLY